MLLTEATPDGARRSQQMARALQGQSSAIALDITKLASSQLKSLVQAVALVGQLAILGNDKELQVNLLSNMSEEIRRELVMLRCSSVTGNDSGPIA